MIHPQPLLRTLILVVFATSTLAPAHAAAPGDTQRTLQEAGDAMASAQTLLARDEQKAAKRRLAEAEKLYREVLRQNRDQHDAAVGLAAVYFLQRRYADGVALMTPFHERAPDDLDVTHQLALHLYRSGQQTLAVPLLEKAAADPKRFDAAWLLAQHYYRLGEWQAGMPHVVTYQRARPDDVDALALVGTYYLKTEQFDAAIVALDRYLEAKPGNVSARVNRANALFRKGDTDRAAEEYETLLEQFPERLRYLFNLAAVRIKQKRCGEAVLLLDRFLKHEPKNGTALYFRADCLMTMKRWDDAKAAFERAASVGAANPWVYYGLSHLAWRRGATDEAIKQARKAYELGPKIAELPSWLGTLNRKAARANEALAAHDAAIQLEPKEPAYHVERGRDLWALGSIVAAGPAFETARTLDPRTPGATDGAVAVAIALGVEAAAGGSAETAATHFRHALELDATSVQARANLALVLLATKGAPAASEVLDGADTTTRAAADVQAASAMVALVRGDLEAATAAAGAARQGQAKLVAVVAQVEGFVAGARGNWELAIKGFEEAAQARNGMGLEQARTQAWFELALERLGRGEAGGAREALGRSNRAGGKLDAEDKATLEFAMQALSVVASEAPEVAAKNLAGVLAGARFAGGAWARVRDIGYGYVAYGYLRAGNAAEARTALGRVREKGALGPAWEALATSADDVEARRAYAAGNFAGAEKIWSQMAERGVADPAVQNNLGAARFMLGRASDAEALWQPLAAAGQPSEALFNLGNALARRGDAAGGWKFLARYGASGQPGADKAKERADAIARLFGLGGTP